MSFTNITRRNVNPLSLHVCREGGGALVDYKSEIECPRQATTQFPL